jgi:hypothetical protein
MKTKREELFESAELAWEQYEFDGSNQITIDNYDSTRHAFIQGYILGVTCDRLLQG